MAEPDSIPVMSNNPPKSLVIPSNSNSFTLPENDPELVVDASKYKCPIHHGILRNPIQTLCGHRLCKECLEIYLGNETFKPCPVKDEDEEEIKEVSKENVYPDPGFQREIKQLLVYCQHKSSGCSKKIKYRDFTEHVANCDYRPVECLHKSRGCSEGVPKINVQMHAMRCGFRPISCSLCGQEFNEKDIKHHERNDCPEGVIPCPYKCGIQALKRRDLDNHKSVCSLKPSECKYKTLGCDFTGDKSAVENHEKNVFKHFDFMVTFLSEVENKWKKVERKQVAETKTNNDAIKTMKLKVVSQTETSLKNNKEIEDKMKAFEEKMNAKLTALEGHRLEITQQLSEVQESLRRLNSSGGAGPGPVGDHPQLSRIEIRLAEMDLRFQMIETANYDGTLLWKIRDFNIRRSDAVQGRTVSLYSQPFYSSRFGYKMCARVYLNGDGIGKGTHLSLYFVVMKGEYDALLPWPFSLKITLMLLDQSSNKRHMKDEFVPDPNSTSFHRPQAADMNVASGCPLFVAHAVLDDHRNEYVKDNMLFIKVSVDCSQLPKI